MTGDCTREDLLRRAREIQVRIQEIFDDAEYWNEMNPGQEIDPDPDGQLQRMAAGIAKMFRHEMRVCK